MKKTIKINISGLVFHIDEDAFEKLESYLNKIKSRLRGTPGESEILEDIEARIAELFQEKTSDEKEVVNLDDVNNVISVLGEPEEIDGSEEEDDFEPQAPQPEYREARKRIYRDPDHKYLGGVSSGLGEYLRIDPLIIRIIFIVLTLGYGVGILIYLLLWIVVPEARTRSEKLEMRGESINVSNIEKSIRKEYEQVKTNIEDLPNSKEYRRDRNALSRFVGGIGKLILIFLKVIGGIIGLSFVIAGVTILVAIIGSLVAGHTWFFNDFWDMSGFSVPDIMSVFVDETVAIIGLIAIFALIAIPILGLIYAGVKLLFPFRANDKAIGLSGLGIWVGALVILLIFGASEGMRYNTSARSSESRDIAMDSVNQIYLMVASSEMDVESLEIGFGYYQDVLVSKSDKDLVVMGRPDIDIVRSYGDEMTILMKKRSRGVNNDAARRMADEIEYDYRIKDSIMVLQPYFVLPENVKWREQELDVVIGLPLGTKIFLDESLDKLIHNVENTENLWSDEMLGEAWIMTEEGLTRAFEDTER